MRIPLLFILTSVLVLSASTTHAEMKTEWVHYQLGDVKFDSVLIYDSGLDKKRPGLVMFPNWYGINDGQIEKAKTIAGKDYVILLADVYGNKIRPKNEEEAGAAIAVMYKDRKALRARANAALAQLIAQADKIPLDAKHIGAIGFCFGGASALDLARSGADIAGVVSFHGNLSKGDNGLSNNLKARVLAINGADDTYVPAAQIEEFGKEMRAAGADWQFVNLGGAVHCFAEADAKWPPGCVYNERAAKRAFTMMMSFFAEAFR